MGDRGNIVVRQAPDTNSEDIWFYSHWGGTELPETLKTALAKRWRWTDPTYLARIIFCEMISNSDDLKGECGYGISTSIGDNEHDIIVVDVPTSCVHVLSEKALVNNRLPSKLTAKNTKSIWTFEDYIKLKTLPKI